MSTIIPFTAKLVKFDTTVPFAEVRSRLDIAVNKEGSENIMAKFKSANNQNEFTALINDTTGDSGFLCVLLAFVLSPISNPFFHGPDTSRRSITTDC